MVEIMDIIQRWVFNPNIRHPTAAARIKTKKVINIVKFWSQRFIYVIVQTLLMEINRERDISRECGSTWAKKFEKFLEDLAPVGPASARKYSAVLRGLLSKSSLFTLDGAIKFVKKKNRVYVRASIIKFIEFLDHENIFTEEEAAVWILKIPKVKEPPGRPRQLPTMKELLEVINKLEKEDQGIGRLMFLTGCRIHEALGLKLKDVDFKTGRIILYGKGHLRKKPRPAKVPLEFVQDLEKAAKRDGLLEGEFLFWSNSKASLESKVDMFNAKLKKCCEAVLGRSTGSHDFRRLVATRLLEKTGNIQLVQQILGHEKLETTQRYTKYANRENYLEKAREIMGNGE